MNYQRHDSTHHRDHRRSLMERAPEPDTTWHRFGLPLALLAGIVVWTVFGCWLAGGGR